MRRSLSLSLVAVLLVVAVVVAIYLFLPGSRGARGVASTRASRDSIARVDSAARADVDTSCLASRIGLPCDTP